MAHDAGPDHLRTAELRASDVRERQPFTAVGLLPSVSQHWPVRAVGVPQCRSDDVTVSPGNVLCSCVLPLLNLSRPDRAGTSGESRARSRRNGLRMIDGGTGLNPSPSRCQRRLRARRATPSNPPQVSASRIVPTNATPCARVAPNHGAGSHLALRHPPPAQRPRAATPAGTCAAFRARATSRSSQRVAARGAQ